MPRSAWLPSRMASGVADDDPRLSAWLAERERELADYRSDPGFAAHAAVAGAALREASGRGAVGAPAIGGRLVFSVDTAPGDGRSALVVRRLAEDVGPAVEDGPRALVDPAAVLDDGTAAIDWFSPSPDGTLVLVGLSRSGEERSIAWIFDTASGDRLDDRLDGLRHASIAWLPDGSGFLYCGYPGGRDYGRSILRHRIGEPQSADAELWSTAPDSTDWPDVALSPDGALALVHVSIGWDRTDVLLLPVDGGPARVLVEGRAGRTRLGFDGPDRLLGASSARDPRGELVRIELDRSGVADGGVEDWDLERPAVAEDLVIERALPLGDGVLLIGEGGLGSRLAFLDADGVVAPVGLPPGADLPYAVMTPGQSTLRDRVVARTARGEALFALSSPTEPPLLAAWRPGLGAPVVLDRYSAGPPGLTVRRDEVRASDGARIPVLVVEATDLDASTPPPTLLFGYGGFGLSPSTAYQPVAAAWAALGGRYVIAGIRGGRERGDEWHRSAIGPGRARVVQDFADVAAALVERGLAERDRLAIWGSSNGGLLVAQTIVRHPELCAAAYAAVPITDLLHYHRHSIARLWMSDYGDPDSPADARWLRRESPLQAVAPDPRRPAVIVPTGAHDTRVEPLHSYAFVDALLAAAEPGGRPVLLSVDAEGGHGPGRSTRRQDELWELVLGFLLTELDRRAAR